MRKFLSQLTSVATVSALALTLTVDANAASQQTTGNFIEGGLKNLPVVENVPQLKSRVATARRVLGSESETSAAGRILRAAAGQGSSTQLQAGSFKKSVAPLIPSRKANKAPMRAGAERETAFMMNVISDATWASSAYNFGMYSTPLTGNDLTLCSSEDYFGYIYFYGNYGATYLPTANAYLINCYNSGTIYTILHDPNTWEMLGYYTKSTVTSCTEFGMAADPTDDSTIYSYFYNDDASAYVFGKMAPSQNGCTVISTPTGWSEIFPSLAFDAEGNLYGIRITDGAFCSIDKTTGVATPIFNASVIQALSFNLTYYEKDGCFYANDESALVFDEEGYYVSGVPAMVKIDPAAKTVEKLFDFDHVFEGKGLFLTEVSDPYSPAAPVDLAVDFAGGYTGTVTCTAPNTKINGDRLIGQLDYYVLVDGAEVATGKATAGTAVEATVTVEATGYYTVEVYFESRDGAGAPASVKAWAGRVIPAPAELGDLTVTENPAKPGEVTITWNAVQAAEGTTDFNAADYTYTIVCFEGNDQSVIASGLTETTYTYQVVTEGQAFVGYAVVPVSVMSSYTAQAGFSNDMAVGIPFELPYNESFEDIEEVSENWSLSISSGGLYLGVQGIEASRGDKYLAFMPESNTSGTPARAQISSKKISLKGATEPVLTFDFYNVPRATDHIVVYALEAGNPTALADIETGAGSEREWLSEVIDLKDFTGKDIQLAFILYSTDYMYPVIIDNITVRNLFNHDLAIANVNLPGALVPGVQTDLTVTLENLGKNEATGYTVDIFVNDNKVATATGEAIAAGKMGDVVASFTPNATYPDVNTIVAVVNHATDQALENNTYTLNNVVCSKPNYPAPTDLKGEDKGESVVLTWADPEAPVEAPVTESFENGIAYSTVGFDGWQFIDIDQDNTYGFQGATFPGSGDPMPWIVFDNENPSALKAHSGDKYMAGFCGESVAADNWMISPLLSGKAQTISFYAAEVTTSYGDETLEVLYSTTDATVTSFVKVADINVNSTDWKEYTANLPEGAKYFAIRHTSNDVFMVGVDDITYTPAVPNLTLTGFNVYVDGVKVNDELVSDYTFTYTPATAGAHEYAVSAVYDLGESPACEPVTVTCSGIEDIFAAGVAVYTQAGEIVVANAAGQNVAVYAIDGKTIYNAAVAAQANIPVATGVYIVKVGQYATKVAVK